MSSSAGLVVRMSLSGEDRRRAASGHDRHNHHCYRRHPPHAVFDDGYHGGVPLCRRGRATDTEATASPVVEGIRRRGVGGGSGTQAEATSARASTTSGTSTSQADHRRHYRHVSRSWQRQLSRSPYPSLAPSRLVPARATASRTATSTLPARASRSSATRTSASAAHRALTCSERHLVS